MKTDFRLSLFALLPAVVLSGCKTPGEVETHYVKLDYAEYSFRAAGNQPLVVEVRTSPAEWSAESDASWCRYTEDEFGLTITVDDNVAEAERRAVITVTAGTASQEIEVWQLGAETGVPSRYRYMIDYFGGVISPNGKWFGAFYNDYDENDNTINYPVIINIETDKRIVLGPYPASMFGLADAMAITDQGTLYIDDSVNGGVVGFTPDGDYFLSQAAPGFTGATVIEGSALDGRIMVGWGTGSPEGYTYGPVKIVDGEYQPLPLPELNYRGDAHDQGVMARGISANGEIIYGSTWDNEDAGMIWWDAEGTARYVGEDVRNEREVTMVDWSGSEYTYTLVDGVQTWSGAGQASPDGKWLAGTFTVESLNETRDRINSTYYPAYFNTETGQTTVLEDYEGYGGCGVIDEGLAFMAAVGGMGGSGPVVNLENGATVAYASLEEYVQERFGINVPSGGQFKYMAADGSVLLASTVIAAPWGADIATWYVAKRGQESE